MIQTIEELSLNARPALHTILVDGWVVRFAKGYTRRANSILALYPSRKNILEKISTCENMYRSQHLPVVFKLPGKRRSKTLDAILERRGYLLEAPTSVQLANLENIGTSLPQDVSLMHAETEAWLSASERMHNLAEERRETHRQLLNAIISAKCYASVSIDGQVVACGLGVLQDGYIGLFDIIVDPRYRNQGLGERVVRSLLSWSSLQGAHTAYLQVMLDNPPALNLYTKLGFREEYQYWYRVLNTQPAFLSANRNQSPL